MSFKHEKLEDSVTMRSLVRIASEKGWIKSEPLVKEAANKESDLSPSDNFTENMLKLCSGLRKSGLIKQAEDIEAKFILYKKASASLYDVSGEKGDDLVDAAHPDGSHKLENVDSAESVVETILDQRKKNLEVVDKKPTGKLASNKDILNAVKIALAQDVDKFSLLRKQKAVEETNKAAAYLKSIQGLKEPESRMEKFWTGPSITTPGDVTFTVDDISSKIVNYQLNQLDDDTNRLNEKVNDNFFEFDEKTILKKMYSAVYNAKVSLQNALNYLNGSYDKFLTAAEERANAAKSQEENKQELLKQKQYWKSKLDQWSSSLSNSSYSEKQKDAAFKWIINQKNEIDMADSLGAMKKVSQENERFYNAWIAKIKMNVA